MMSKMLAKTVTSAIAAARPALLESHGYLSNPAANSEVLHRSVGRATRPEVMVTDPPVLPRPPVRLHAVKVVAAPRVRLDITLPIEQCDPSHDQLQHLLHSGLGAYVADITVGARKICVELNLAQDDLDFAFHTLISKVSAATIGPVQLRPAAPSL